MTVSHGGSDGKHYGNAVTHFEWRQMALDDMLARLGKAARETVNAKDQAALSMAICEWSKAQGQLDKDVANYNPRVPS